MRNGKQGDFIDGDIAPRGLLKDILGFVDDEVGELTELPARRPMLGKLDELIEDLAGKETEQATAAPAKGPLAVAAAGHQDVTPAIPVLLPAAPHETTALQGSRRMEKPRSRAWCHDAPPEKESVFIRGPITGTQEEVQAALDMRWPTIEKKQDATFYVVEIKKGKYAVYFQHQEQFAEASKRLEEFKRKLTRSNRQ